METILFALLVLLASGAAQAQEAQTSVAHGASIVSDSLHTNAPTDTLLYMDDQTLDEVVVSVRRPTLSAYAGLIPCSTSATVLQYFPPSTGVFRPKYWSNSLESTGSSRLLGLGTAWRRKPWNVGAKWTMLKGKADLMLKGIGLFNSFKPRQYDIDTSRYGIGK